MLGWKVTHYYSFSPGECSFEDCNLTLLIVTELSLTISPSPSFSSSYLIVIGEVVADKCRNKPWGFGYNAATDTYEDLLITGVLDPAKVITHPLDTFIHDTLSPLRLFVTTFATIQISSYLTLSI